jgi:integrase
VRGLSTVKTQIKILRKYFGKRRIRSITYTDIQTYRNERLQSKGERTGKPIAIATVNRELATLRRMLNVALTEDWITSTPFNRGAPLISQADETKRERVLSREEERRLLDACATLKRRHLRPLIICALDTGMRRGELLKLQWKDVDLEGRVIHIKSFNTKTMKARDVPVSKRLLAELQHLWEVSPKDPEELAFGIKDNARMAFVSARHEAKLDDVRFHDLRHTAATRFIQSGMSLTEVGRILGHTVPMTTYRYVNPDTDTIQRAAAAMDSFHEQQNTVESSSRLIN